MHVLNCRSGVTRLRLRAASSTASQIKPKLLIIIDRVCLPTRYNRTANRGLYLVPCLHQLMERFKCWFGGIYHIMQYPTLQWEYQVPVQCLTNLDDDEASLQGHNPRRRHL
jgi:hypothetical protein